MCLIDFSNSFRRRPVFAWSELVFPILLLIRRRRAPKERRHHDLSLVLPVDTPGALAFRQPICENCFALGLSSTPVCACGLHPISNDDTGANTSLLFSTTFNHRYHRRHRVAADVPTSGRRRALEGPVIARRRCFPKPRLSSSCTSSSAPFIAKFTFVGSSSFYSRHFASARELI